MSVFFEEFERVHKIYDDWKLHTSASLFNYFIQNMSGGIVCVGSVMFWEIFTFRF